MKPDPRGNPEAIRLCLMLQVDPQIISHQRADLPTTKPTGCGLAGPNGLRHRAAISAVTDKAHEMRFLQDKMNIHKQYTTDNKTLDTCNCTDQLR
jgi:hypothetical protein